MDLPPRCAFFDDARRGFCSGALTRLVAVEERFSKIVMCDQPGHQAAFSLETQAVAPDS